LIKLFDPFAEIPGFNLEERIQSRAAACGLDLEVTTVTSLADQARAVLRESAELHLTSITDPEEFIERHLGESFEGASMLPPDVEGVLLDVGSGNGYPGLPLAATRPGLEPLLAEASTKKASFLRAVIGDAGFPTASVLEAQVQRSSDLEDVGPIRLVTSRAMGGWAKILPRLHASLADDGEILVWCGEEMEGVAKRVVWKRFELVDRRALPGRERSWIWRFRITSQSD